LSVISFNSLNGNRNLREKFREIFYQPGSGITLPIAGESISLWRVVAKFEPTGRHVAGRVADETDPALLPTGTGGIGPARMQETRRRATPARGGNRWVPRRLQKIFHFLL